MNVTQLYTKSKEERGIAMYTEKRYAGKFEACESVLVAKALLNATADDEIGDVSCGEWYGLFKGQRQWFILEEDNQGFVQYVSGKPQEIKEKWEEIVAMFEEGEEEDESQSA